MRKLPATRIVPMSPPINFVSFVTQVLESSTSTRWPPPRGRFF